MESQLLAGPAPAAGAESLPAHLGRLGHLRMGGRDALKVVERSGLLGRGGAAFPVARKWLSVAERGGGDARVLANGAEGEPMSAKDRTLMALRPHLVIDGAQIAAAALGASEIVIYVGGRHGAARAALARALAERHGRWRSVPTPVRLVVAPDAFVAGEESAAVHFVNEGDARPTATPPRPYERGIGGRPTLVQNVETLGRVALLARSHGDSIDADSAARRTLVTVSGASHSGVLDVPADTPIGELAALTGVDFGATQAVLFGGYSGNWTTPITAWSLPAAPLPLRSAGVNFGSGVVAFLGGGQCGVALTARMLDYLAGQSAAQCGPCVFGLRAIADTLADVAKCRAGDHDMARVAGWQGQLFGRGACHHPDGAAGLLASAMLTFADDFAAHVRKRRCITRGRAVAA